MTVPPPPPTTRSYARRVGITLLVLGLLALPLAGLVLLFTLLLPSVQDDPALRQQLADLQQQWQVGSDGMRIAMAVGSGICGVYALASLAIGIGLLASRRAGWRTAATVLCGLVLTLMTLNVLSALMSGAAADLLAATVLAVPHALALIWLTRARLAPTVTPPIYVPPPYRPMQDYYRPPVPPSHAA